MRHTTAVMKNKETLVTCGPPASHLLGRTELGPGRASFGAGVKNCIHKPESVGWGGGLQSYQFSQPDPSSWLGKGSGSGLVA